MDEAPGYRRELTGRQRKAAWEALQCGLLDRMRDQVLQASFARFCEAVGSTATACEVYAVRDTVAAWREFEALLRMAAGGGKPTEDAE